MPGVICKDGKEVTIQGVISYLERQYGMPPSHIRHVAVSATVGEPITISLELIQQREEPAEVEITRMDSPVQEFLRPDKTIRQGPLRGNVQPLDASEYGEVPEGWMPESQRPEREPGDRPFCLDHGAGCSGWPRHEGWTPSELDA